MQKLLVFLFTSFLFRFNFFSGFSSSELLSSVSTNSALLYLPESSFAGDGLDETFFFFLGLGLKI